MAFAVSGFATVAQNYISKQIASNFYTKAPLLAVLGALSIGNNKKNSLQIGRPNSAEILSGRSVSPAEKRMLSSINEYVARIQAFKTNNTAPRTNAGRVNAPTVANPSTNSHGQAMQAGAKFKWSHIDTPLLIWHEDKDRAEQQGTPEGQGIAMSQIVDEATEVGLQDHTDWLQDKVWNGVPTSQSTDLWDAPSGITEATDTTNTYGQIDRSDAANSVWRSQKDTTLTTTDIKTIVDDANLTKQIRVKGNGVNLMLTTTAIYQIFKRQILSAGGAILQNGLPAFAQLGMTKEMLQLDNVMIMYDPTCPASTVVGLDLSTWKFMVNPKYNFRVTPFKELSVAQEGGKFADQAFVQTRFMLTCDNPYLNVRYTAINT